MPKVSVIVPVYNTEKYLPRCIESILAQTFTDFELILVNDGSTDNSGKICDEYAKKDSRIVVIHKENGGASSARNKGLEIAQGEWISFVDSDDWISSKYIEALLLDISKDQEVDFVIQGITICTKNTQQNYSPNICDIYKNNELNSLWRDLNLFRYCGSYGKLFRLNLLNKYNIRYNSKIICAEDYEFMLKYIIVCSKIKLSNTANYFYDKRDGSLSTKIYSFDKELNGLMCLDEAYTKVIHSSNRVENILTQYYNLVAYYTHRVLISIYLENGSNAKNRISQLNKIKHKYIENYKCYYIPETFFLKIIKYLFINKYFRLLDAILYIRLTK